MSIWFKRFVLAFLLLFQCLDLYAFDEVVDLSHIDFNSNEIVQVNASWAFYWQQFINPAEFEKKVFATPFLISGFWNKNNTGLPPIGFGTYHLKILLNPIGNKSISLVIPGIHSACKIWINNKLILESGKVSANKTAYNGRLETILLHAPEESVLDVVIWVSNYSYFTGGIKENITIGNTSTIFRYNSIKRGVENLLAGSLIALFIYFSFLFSLYKKGKAFLYLSWICLIIGVRALVTNGGSNLLPDLLRSIDIEFWKKIEFGGVYVLLLISPLYMQSLFPKEFSPWVIRIAIIIVAPMIVCVILFNQFQYGLFLDIFNILITLEILYSIFVAMIAYRHGRVGAKIILNGIVFSFPLFLIEFLQDSSIVMIPYSIDFAEMGILVYLLFQSFSLARLNAKAYNELNQLNQNLEEKIYQRTKQLSYSNHIKDTVLSILSHDLKSPLNSLRGMINIFSLGAISKDELESCVSSINTQIQAVDQLIENILFWASRQLNGIAIKKEVIDLNRIVSEHLVFFNVLSDRKKIQLKSNLNGSLNVLADKDIICLVLRNLLANAIKFSNPNGKICIDCLVDDLKVWLSVKDSGIGMSDETLKSIFKSNCGNKSIDGTNNEKGTGLGLSLCKEYLERMEAEIRVESELGKGTIFWISLDRVMEEVCLS